MAQRKKTAKEMNYIPTHQDKELSLTWFYDEIPEEYQNLRKFVQGVEQEYLELRHLLRTTEDDLKDNENHIELQARARYLRKRIAAMERKFPWLVAEQVLEYALFGVPH